MQASTETLIRPDQDVSRDSGTPVVPASKGLVAPPAAPATVHEVQVLKRQLARAAGRLRRSLPERVRVLGKASRRWMDPDDPFRQAALACLVDEAGYPAPTAAAGLDATFEPWTPEAWKKLVESELGALREDSPAGSSAARARAGSPSHAATPKEQDVVVHVLGSALPAPNILPLWLALLLGRPTLARVGRHLPSLPGLALATISALDPELASLGGTCRWPRSRQDLTVALFEGADIGSATGGNEAVGAIRAALGPGTRLLCHPYRASVAYVGKSVIGSEASAGEAAVRLSRDVALHDQQGCLSPVGVLVECATTEQAGWFASLLAKALDARQREWPRSQLTPDAALAVRSFHDWFAVGSGAFDRQSRPRTVWAGQDLSWVVGICAPGDPPPPSALFRCLWIGTLAEPNGNGGAVGATAVLRRLRGTTAAIGFQGNREERKRARALARSLGASRCCALGSMQSPPLTWRQDGFHPLRSLLT
jgi:hypothetical protein